MEINESLEPDMRWGGEVREGMGNCINVSISTKVQTRLSRDQSRPIASWQEGGGGWGS